MYTIQQFAVVKSVKLRRHPIIAVSWCHHAKFIFLQTTICRRQTMKNVTSDIWCVGLQQSHMSTVYIVKTTKLRRQKVTCMIIAWKIENGFTCNQFVKVNSSNLSCLCDSWSRYHWILKYISIPMVTFNTMNSLTNCNYIRHHWPHDTILLQ